MLNHWKTIKRLFSLAKADGMCVFWDDEIDVCPDMLYKILCEG